MTTASRPYKSSLRKSQAETTRRRILEAAAELLEREGGPAVTNRRIAELADITEMTVYRHFPSRSALDEALWRHMNESRGVAGGFPDRLDEIAPRLARLFASFDAAPAHILSTITTPVGREMRASQDEVRRIAFLTAVEEGAPNLAPDDRRRAAAVLQLLYSAYPWLSLREQWNLNGEDAAQAVAWAVDTLVKDLRSRGDAPLATNQGTNR
jgi:AcrR family transcriptional regulator